MNTELIDKFHMLPPGCRVLCAVSGGADSVYLLCSLLDMAKERGFTVCAGHYNHALRGAESDRDQSFVEKLCGGLDVPLMCEKGDVAEYARENSLSTEDAARSLRYAFLQRAARSLGAERIATAHTANDNAETLLLNLARGSGLRGMGGIPPLRENIIRPMLATTRAEVEEYLAARGLPHVEDSTNAADDYARNRVRHAAVPALESVNAGFAVNASRAALLLRRDEEFLDSLARKLIADDLTERGIPAAALSAAPFPVASRAVRLMARKPLPAQQVEAVLALSAGEGLAALDVTGGRFTREQGCLRFGAEDARPIPDTPLESGGETYIAEAKATVRTALIEPGAEIHSSLNTFFFNYESICGIISCTSRRPGDKIRLLGRGCTKNLSDIFTEKKLTQRERERTLIFRDEKGPIAVQGAGIAERCAPKRDKISLRIDIEVGEKLL